MSPSLLDQVENGLAATMMPVALFIRIELAGVYRSAPDCRGGRDGGNQVLAGPATAIDPVPGAGILEGAFGGV
jgi:hypothetical protein